MMRGSVHRRVFKLEGALNCREPVCRTCGAPQTIKAVVVLTFGDDPLPQCSECGRRLDPESGAPLPNSYKRIMRGMSDREPAWVIESPPVNKVTQLRS